MRTWTSALITSPLLIIPLRPLHLSHDPLLFLLGQRLEPAHVGTTKPIVSLSYRIDQ